VLAALGHAYCIIRCRLSEMKPFTMSDPARLSPVGLKGGCHLLQGCFAITNRHFIYHVTQQTCGSGNAVSRPTGKLPSVKESAEGWLRTRYVCLPKSMASSEKGGMKELGTSRASALSHRMTSIVSFGPSGQDGWEVFRFPAVADEQE
jgi:hypothetical protein